MTTISFSTYPLQSSMSRHTEGMTYDFDELASDAYSTFHGDATAHKTNVAISTESIESVKSLQYNLNTLAAVATFLAAVQAQVITYTFQQNDTPLRISINAFFFVALLLDVLAACGAFVTASVVQRHYDLLLRRALLFKSIALGINKEIHPSFRFIDMTFLHAFRHARAEWGGILQKMRAFESALDNAIGPSNNQTLAQWEIRISLAKFQHTTTELSKGRQMARVAFAVSSSLPTIAAVGVMCLLLGTLCYVKDAQPIAVWVCCFAAVGVMLLSFGLLVWKRL